MARLLYSGHLRERRRGEAWGSALALPLAKPGKRYALPPAKGAYWIWWLNLEATDPAGRVARFLLSKVERPFRAEVGTSSCPAHYERSALTE